ncbi:MAG: chromosome segregation protein SMC [Lachnospiraceae bacterium]
MYLKSIEIQGFKSFANKIVFEFHNGITGIVGPNGSGKSNVADAVRWVLGEQKIKQLRGASMQDVIFSGTEQRKPQGYAYVAITLDNSDHQLNISYDEVTVARKLYRSGESEYLLNGTECRLKDVYELFYDTGIGKEGYSIIGQGQIDKILSGKPEERRELFDEAAGIVKYKKRKSAAQKKLEDEKQNLVRVNDILAELEKQIGPLEKQSEKAKEYLKKKEELKKLDVNYFLLENEHTTEQLESVGEKLKIAEGEYQESTARFENIKQEYDEMQQRIEELEQSIEETRNSLSNTSSIRSKLTGEINVLKEQINSARNNIEHFKTRLTSIEENVGQKEKECAALTESKNKADEILRSLEEKRNVVREALQKVQSEIESISASIETDKNRIIETLNERATIRSKKERYDTMLEQIMIRRSELNSKFLQAKSNEEEQQGIVAKLKEEFEKVNQEIEELNYQQKKKEERAGQIHDELGAADRSLREAQVQYHQDKTKLESITNLTERYEGYGNSIRKVMERKEANSGIIGVVADIIKVEKKYETAIETALGGNIQNIVTEDEKTAKEMIQYLKDNKFGRATFLPLTSIEHPQEFKTPEVLDEQGVIGMADAIVSTESAYRMVAKAMLGRIVVVDHVDHALKIARKYDYGIRMVTLEGELLVPGGAISGGAFKNNSNLLGRRREMDELDKKVKESLKQINDYLDQIEQIKAERNKLRVEIEEIKLKIQNQFIAQNTARLNLIKAQERIDETVSGVDDLKAEQAEIEKQIREIKEQQEQIDEQLNASATEEKALEEQIVTKQASLDGKREEEAVHAAQVTEQDVEVEKALQKQEFEQQNVSRLQEELARFTAEREEVLQAMKQNEGDIAEKEENIENLSQTMDASYTTQEDSEIRLKEMQARKEEYTAKQKQFFSFREELNDKIAGLDKEVYRLKTQKEKLDDILNGLAGYMWSEYELTLRDAKELRDESMTDLLFLKRSVAEYKDSIKRLGDVNVNAIEDFKAVSERYEFLKKQHDDLIEAEKMLNDIIANLDQAMRTQFTEKFAEINKEFNKVFKEMFGGGTGSLELMEGEDILEAGIRIIAQPPGKKLQNMMQLSGGEKALAAIALLFAIQNLKPSPFCLLDEIEAALDESNVGRFAQYLHKLTKHTQFIVITHRRGTMEKADRLYGITMQEKGVSALVSVNLIDKELDN